MQNNDIESELSYAYVHAVASAAGFSCHVPNRHMDNQGIDAILHATGHFGGAITQLTVHVQLKATIKTPAESPKGLSYFLSDLKQYEKLRQPANIPKILIVLFLPQDKQEWVIHTENVLALKHCAYWVSLSQAPDVSNSSGTTLYLPKEQCVSPSGLNELMKRLSYEEELTYAG